MGRFRTVGIASLIFAFFASAASAQSLNQPSGRDSLWNGTLIGLGVGVGSAAALDGVFCDNGFGGCDFPWKAYLTLGGIGAAAGAGIDLLIGRGSKTTVRLSPIIGSARKGVRASLMLPQRESLPALKAQDRPPGGRRDSVWNGGLIGAGIGAAVGAIADALHD